MNYPSMLRQTISKSGLSLREIAYRCRSERNVPLDPSYISKLQSGKQAPPAEDISRAIAEVCGGDPDSLVFQGYMDHAPRLIVDLIQAVESMMKTFFNVMAQSRKTPPQTLAMIQKQFNDMTPYAVLKDLISAFQFRSDPDDDSMVLPGPDGRSILQFASPSLGINPPMPDDSMEPLIPKGAKLEYKMETEYKHGDIVLVRIGNDYTSRKIMYLGDQTLLLAINSKFQPITMTDDAEPKIIGRVTSVAHDIPRS